MQQRHAGEAALALLCRAAKNAYHRQPLDGAGVLVDALVGGVGEGAHPLAVGLNLGGGSFRV